MHISKTYQAVAVMFTALLTTTVAGQTSDYPWRAEQTGAQKPIRQYIQASSSTLRQDVQAQIPDVPEPPKVGLDNAIAPVQQQEIEVIPEASNYNFDSVPGAPGDGEVYNSVVQPGLSVQSNANDPEPNYCFRPRKQWCNLGCQKRLFNQPIAGVNIGGFSQFGYHARNILPFNNRRDRFNMHQTWLHFDTAGSNSPLRFRLDTVYGLDAQEFQAVGNRTTGAPDGWDNDFDHGSFGWAVPQAFVEFGLSNWQVKVGKFLSPIGYEAAPSTENFFYSRTYARRFIEPFSHTGILAEQNNGGAVTRLVGLTAGWDTAFESNESGFNLLTGMRFQPNAFTRLTTTSSIGDTGYRGSGTLWSGVAEVQLTNKVSYVGQVDYLNLNLNSTDEFSVINGLYYCHNQCLSFGSRLEWFKSDQLQAATASTYDYTVGMNYRPNANILIRPEVRWDWGENALDNGDVNFGFDTIFTF